MRVRLTDDLTRYDARLVIGSEGDTCGPQSMWARGSDCFTGVLFDNGACLDVLWKGLEIIDTEVLAKRAAAKKAEDEAAAAATRVVLRLGVRSAFRNLTFHKKRGKYAFVIYNSERSDELLAIMDANGVEVRTIHACAKCKTQDRAPRREWCQRCITEGEERLLRSFRT